MLPGFAGREVVVVEGDGVAAGGVVSEEHPAKAKTASDAAKRCALSLVCIVCVSALASASKAAGAALGFSERVDDIEGNLQHGNDHQLRQTFHRV